MATATIATLRRFLARHDMTPTDLALRAGMNTPNAIYNFLKGRSDSLSQRTIAWCYFISHQEFKHLLSGIGILHRYTAQGAC